MSDTQFMLDEDYDGINIGVIDVLPMPLQNGITIYGKSDCPSCIQLKFELDELCDNTSYINCDAYLSSNKEAFKQTMFSYMHREYTGQEKLSFPVIFRDAKYVPKEYFYDIETYDA